MTATPDPKAHQLLGGLAQQARYVHELAKAGREAEALEHATGVDRLITAWRNAAHPDKQVARRDDLEQLVRNLAQPEPCRLDHNGSCQEHFWFVFSDNDAPCPHGRAQALFPDIKE